MTTRSQYLVLAAVLLFVIGCAPSSELAEVNGLLSSERWQDLTTKSQGYLQILAGRDSTNQIPSLRYAHLLGCAGQIFEGTMSYVELRTAMKDYVGSTVSLPAYIVSDSRGPSFNLISAGRNPRQAFVTSTNRQGTTILCWVYANLDTMFNPVWNQGRTATITGTVSNLEFNPNESTIWIMRMELEPAKLVYRD